jgi:hypothetical protein
MPDWTEDDWGEIVDSVRERSCTPVIGRYVEPLNHPYPIDAHWVLRTALERQLPPPNPPTLENLSYLHTLRYPDSNYLRRRVRQELMSVQTALGFNPQDEPLRDLANLQLPFYVTTAFHSFFFQAFDTLIKEPKRLMCRWWSETVDRTEQDQPIVHFLREEDIPRAKVNSPIIYHLFGVAEQMLTMVFNEDDYFEFYANTSTPGPTAVISPTLDGRLGGGNALLFLGYDANDWDFKVVFHFLHRLMNKRRIHVAVQLRVDETLLPEPERAPYKERYTKYLQTKFNVSVYWGTCQEFMQNLKERLA